VKIKGEDGYALPSVLLISLLVITMLLSILSIIYFTNKGTSKLIEEQKLRLACYSVVQMALVDSSLFFSDSSVVEQDNYSVLLRTMQYGFWREVVATIKGTIDSVKFRYLIGSQSTENGYFENAIVISRPNLRATVVGNTEIIGDILGTSDQIIMGNIFGEPPIKKDYHKGKKKIDHNIKTQLIADSLFKNISSSISSQKLVFMDDDEQEINELNIEQFGSDGVYNFSGNLRISGKIKSKIKESIKLKAKHTLQIAENTKIKRPLELYADSLIVINKNCIIENVILYSNGPIIIEEGSTFKNVQIFSTDSIDIKGSQFNYPSIICLSIDDTISSNQNKAIIIENSIVNGSVLLMTNTSGLSSNRTKIKIDSDSKVQGLVYSENNLELYGEVLGTAFTYNFWYFKEPTEYINWLINVKVNREKLDKWFLLPLAISSENNYQILKEEWIY
jgi:cytoskeletal protein CcmA (bactofilin family)